MLLQCHDSRFRGNGHGGTLKDIIGFFFYFLQSVPETKALFRHLGFRMNIFIIIMQFLNEAGDSLSPSS